MIDPAAISHIDPDLIPILTDLQNQINNLQAGSQGAPVDIITWKPVIAVFAQNVAGSISVSQFGTSSLGLPLTISLNPITLPAGIAYDQAVQIASNVDAIRESFCNPCE